MAVSPGMRPQMTITECNEQPVTNRLQFIHIAEYARAEALPLPWYEVALISLLCAGPGGAEAGFGE